MSIEVSPSPLVSDKVRTVLLEMANSGSSEEFNVAETLADISANATTDEPEQATDDYLCSCAVVIANSANAFISHITGSRRNLFSVPRVLIVVDGGVVQSVLSDAPVLVKIKDFDNIKAGDAESYLASVNDYDEPDQVLSPEALNIEALVDVEQYKGAK